MDIGTMLLWSVLFGSIGLGYFIYGKRQQKLIPLFTGIALNVFPFFMSNVYALVIVGVILVLMPWFL